jgi:hypothetical protein
VIELSRRSFAMGLVALLIPASVWSRGRRRVVVRRTRIVVVHGHPIRRSVNRVVVVRPARRVVTVSAPLVFSPLVAFRPAVVVLPPRERLIWQDTETIDRDEDWVESNFGVDEKGDALYMEVDGKADFDFADITFENGEVQVVDFNQKSYGKGIYMIHSFAGRRNVKTVRLVARSKADETTLRLFIST